MLGRSGDMSAFAALIEHHASIKERAGWLIGETAPVVLFGLIVVSVVTAAVGYFLAKWLWRERMGRKWRTRLLRRRRARELDLALDGGASGTKRGRSGAMAPLLVPPPERRGLPAFPIILGAAVASGAHSDL